MESIANGSLLYMQGIRESKSEYYHAHGVNFVGISVAPEYQEGFEALKQEALGYYEY